MAENAIEIQEKPILFSGAMVRAVIEGRKTQTRRVAKLACDLADKHKNVRMESGDGLFLLTREAMHSPKLRENFCFACPYGKPGDRLWVRETSRVEECKYGDHAGIFNVYLADNALLPVPSVNDHAKQEEIDNWWRKHLNGKNIPSIFMPRWASRLTLEIVNVKVERVQEISGFDCLTEGIPEQGGNSSDGEWRLREAFRKLWDSINEKRGFGWTANPWTWAIEFKVLAAGERRA